MPTRFIETNSDKAMLVRFIESQPLPFAASITRGGKRSLEQNRLQRLWLNEISEQMGDRTPEEIRGYCKLHFGVPILRDQDEVFREKYDKAVKPLPYEQKLAIMTEPLDLPVTRLMTTKQHASYLDAIHKHFSEQGIVLTDPEALSHNYNPQSSDTPSPSGDNGSDGAPPPPESSVAAYLSEPAGGGPAEEGAIASETASKAGHGGQSAPSSGLSDELRGRLLLLEECADAMFGAATHLNAAEREDRLDKVRMACLADMAEDEGFVDMAYRTCGRLIKNPAGRDQAMPYLKGLARKWIGVA